ncbi:MAG: OmpA family protein [Thermoanaerobaculia bacterium]
MRSAKKAWNVLALAIAFAVSGSVALAADQNPASLTNQETIAKAENAVQYASQAGAPLYANGIYSEATSKLQFAKQGIGSSSKDVRNDARKNALEAFYAARAAETKARWIQDNREANSLATDIRNFGGTVAPLQLQQEPTVAIDRGSTSRDRVQYAISVWETAAAAGARAAAPDEMNQAHDWLQTAKTITRHDKNNDSADYLAYVSEMMARHAMYTARLTDVGRTLPGLRMEKSRLEAKANENEAAAQRAARLQAEQQAAQLRARLQAEQQQREAETAAAAAAMRADVQNQVQSLQQQISETNSQLQQTREELAARDAAAQAQKEQLQAQVAQTQAQLEQTRQQLAAREAADQAQKQKLDQMQQAFSEIAKTREDQRGLIVTIPGIFFETGKSALAPGAKDVLRKIAAQLKENPKLVIQIEGHTDSVGSADYNQQLSEARADAVRDFLTSQGVAPAEMSTVGKGESEPVASNATSAGRQQNRRVELVITTSAQQMAQSH